MTKHTFGILLAAWIALTVGPAHAFCGFYVSGAGGDLFSNATTVVLMREGTRTVQSMQNNYDGPPEDFAMIVPVPVVLHEEDVKTLPHEIFDRIDQLAAPRLVEYWETDPCYVEPEYDDYEMMAEEPMMAEAESAREHGVTIEAQFVVGEYQIVILSADDSTGLDTWLRQENYHIPEGAEPVLRPYVEAGTKFFVARVDLERVRRVDGHLQLSPLRFHFDSPDFSLPVRLGLLNSAGAQDLIVHILARRQRYDVANYENVTIPTNLIVSNAVRNEFGPFYAALFDRLLERHPNHVVTEYSWDAMTCDPCPGEPLTEAELSTLGADVLPGDPYAFTLTRLHYRYTREQLGEDLVFRAARPIVGGRGQPNARGELDQQVRENQGTNNFQGRYAILHWWDRPVSCSDPERGRWGGPPSNTNGSSGPVAATDIAFAERGRALDRYLEVNAPEVGVTSRPRPSGPPPLERTGCTGCATTSSRTLPLFGSLMLLGLLLVIYARRA